MPHFPRLRRPLVAVPAVGLAVSLATVAPAAAHTGDPAGGGVADGLAHPVLGLDHLLVMVAVGVLAAVVADRRVAWATPVAFVGGMLLGGLAGLAGATVGGVEVAIAASVVVIGVLVAAPATARQGWWLPGAAVVMGSLHGVAHGVEAPSGAVPAAYLLGVVAATAALHLSGAATGLALRSSPVARAVTGALVSVTGVAMLLGS